MINATMVSTVQRYFGIRFIQCFRSIRTAPVPLETAEPFPSCFLILYRRESIIGTVPPPTAVDELNAVEQSGPNIVARRIDSFPFQQLEEAFGYRIGMAVSTSTHRAVQLVVFDERLPFVPGVLTGLVGVKEETPGSGLRFQTSMTCH